MASTADIRNGVVLNMDGGLWTVIEFQHVKPGKGGAFVRTKVKNVRTGKTVDRTFNAGAKIEVETVDRSDFQYLYKDGDGFVFMNTSDYDQITLSEEQVGDSPNFMLENQDVTIALHNGEPLYVELPASVVLESLACRGTARPVERSRRPWRPDTRSRSRSSSSRAPRSRSTRAPGTTSAA